ncbi:MAG: NPCBM/NEW2 domain-containing protein [Armatimonadetes bacterium]|nr:NPCBM/NEW2 domain-containing protein [Armatimonadota bacterium]
MRFRFILAALLLAGGVRAQQKEYLSDIPQRFSMVQMGWGELGLDTAAHAPGQKPLSLAVGSKAYAKGLGHHASGEIVVELNGEYDLFECEVGVQKQPYGDGSVIFRVFVDGKKRFDSGVMRQKNPARPVRLNVSGADELRLATADAGDGITCDVANWANARLTRSPVPKTPDRPKEPPMDIARFARVMSWAPARMDGSRANRVEEFRAEDVFLGTEIRPSAEGVYTAAGSIGLQWMERRRLRELALEFAGSEAPPTDGAAVQGWFGESAWQGQWLPLRGSVVRQENRWRFHAQGQPDPNLAKGTLKIRWILPFGPVAVKMLTAISLARWDTVTLRLEANRLQSEQGHIEVYNGEIIEPSGSAFTKTWDISSPLRLPVRYSRPQVGKLDRTVLRFRLPGGAFGVAVDDVLENGGVWVRDADLYVTYEPGGMALAAYRRKNAGRKTVLQRVRFMPDQTLARAMRKARNPIQNNGPVMLSLAWDNHKFVVQREGAIQFERHPDSADQLLYYPLKYACSLTPRFGSGANPGLTRRMEEGWLPAPIITIKEGGVAYRQRAFVAPYRNETQRPLGVAEFTIENTLPRPAPVSLAISCMADAEKQTPADGQKTPGGAAFRAEGQLLAAIDTTEAGALQADVEGGIFRLNGTLPAHSRARCYAYIPQWKATSDEAGALSGGADLGSAMADYWKRIMASAAGIAVPDPFLENLIRASQVHCLIAARSEDEGRRVAPWIASMIYGPLESEANSIIRGMQWLGHTDFSRRSLEYFIHRYSPAGFLTTGYTLMGTGWHLWTLGEYYRITKDSDWLQKAAPEVARVCQWVIEQRRKTMQTRASGEKAPEYGLMPPGIIADWNAFAYYFALNGYYYAGLKHAAEALHDIGYPGADSLLEEAGRFRQDILRAYRWTQARMPVYRLQSGDWVTGYPSQLHGPGPTSQFFPGEDGNRSWAYDVEAGAQQLVPQGILEPSSPDVSRMLDHLEDVQFLSEGWFDYPADLSRKDWFNRGGFSKVQPYYTRNAEIYALRDEAKPFVRSYFNSLASLVSEENMSFWEHFRNAGAWNKTHETGYFLHQTRLMLLMERGPDLWLTPLIPSDWLKDGKTVSLRNAPSCFGPVSYRIHSRIARGYIEAVIEPPASGELQSVVLRLRHPGGKPIRSASVNGEKVSAVSRDTIRLKPGRGELKVRAEF